MAGPTARAATSSAFASARRWTRSWADSPGTGVSSTAEDITVKVKPAARKISARRGEAEARMSFVEDTLGKNTTRGNRKQPALWNRGRRIATAVLTVVDRCCSIVKSEAC